MTATVAQIRQELERFQGLLHTNSLFSFSEEEKKSLLEDLNELDQRLSTVQASFLTIGILGGTGVGKSTLMNALAGMDIASTSHRRPHTDHVLIYKHEDVNSLPALEMQNLPWHVVTHSGDAVKHVLLCDLPDYDSLTDEHRQRVLNFLEHLDVLVWVTSLEKYGDSRFYEFLRQTPKAEQNFIFVLNKTDLLFQGQSAEKGYDQLNRVLTTFRHHIREQDMADPLLYALSSQEAADGGDLAPWNQFPAFRQHIFLQRDMKHVVAIKAANLEVEAQRLLSSLQKETRDLEKFVRLLDEVARDLATRKPSWLHGSRDGLDSWLATRVKSGIMRYRSDPNWLIGPGHGIALILQSFQGRSGQGPEDLPDLSAFKPPESIILSYRKPFEWAEEHLGHAVHRENLAAPFGAKVKETVKVPKRFEALGVRFFNAVVSFVAQPAPAFKVFKLFQGLAYALLFAFFLLAVGGENAWLEFLRDPGAGNGLRLLVTMIHTVFSTRGLAALGSYALLNLFLGFRFYRSYQRLARKASQKTLEALRIALSRIWEESLDEVVNDLEGLKSEMTSRLEAIHKIC
jgi:GTP-binding protein EngB required for normal cell division